MTAAIHISANGLTAIYLVSAVCFILALKALSSPRTARYGNLVGVAGMVVAVLFTFLVQQPGHDWVIGSAMGLGALVAVPTARKVRVTAMPQMVAIFNGVGGAAAAVISLAEYLHDLPLGVPVEKGIPIVFALVVGCVSFAGSTLAFAKLQELMTGRPVLYPGQQVVNGIIAVAILALGVLVVVTPHLVAITLLAVAALALGAGIVLPVGGADTPVLISLLNSFTGLAVAADGFVLDNVILVIAGTLVGASGALLTKMMSDAMGRSLPKIILGGFGAAPEGGALAVGGRRRTNCSQRRCRRYRDPSRLFSQGNDRPRLWAGRSPGTARGGGVGQGAGGSGCGSRLRNSPCGRPHARAHERTAGGGRRAL